MAKKQKSQDAKAPRSENLARLCQKEQGGKLGKKCKIYRVLSVLAKQRKAPA
jgi:hypothetical protein